MLEPAPCVPWRKKYMRGGSDQDCPEDGAWILWQECPRDESWFFNYRVREGPTRKWKKAFGEISEGLRSGVARLLVVYLNPTGACFLFGILLSNGQGPVGPVI